jgi:hypothetical protein
VIWLALLAILVGLRMTYVWTSFRSDRVAFSVLVAGFFLALLGAAYLATRLAPVLVERWSR